MRRVFYLNIHDTQNGNGLVTVWLSRQSADFEVRRLSGTANPVCYRVIVRLKESEYG